MLEFGNLMIGVKEGMESFILLGVWYRILWDF